MKKFTKNYIYYNLIRNFFVAIFFTFFLMGSFNTSEDEALDKEVVLIINLISFLIIYLFLAIYNILYVNTSGYELKEKEISCKRGVLFRKKSVVEYKRMHAINKKQNFIQQWFGIAVLTIDSGSTNTSTQAEIMIIEKDDVIDKLLVELKNKQNESTQSTTSTSTPTPTISNEETKSLYDFDSKSKVIYAVLNLITSLISIVFFAIICWIGISVCLPFIEFESGMTLSSFLVSAVAWTIIIILVISFLTFVTSILFSFVNYYQFKISKNESELQISYGLLVKMDNRFQLKKIKAVVIQQNIIQRLLHFASINLEVVGYQEMTNQKEKNNKQIGIMVPLCKEAQVNEIVDRILPEYVLVKKGEKSISFASFILWPFLISALLIMIPSVLALLALLLAKVELGIVLLVLFCSLTLVLIVYIHIFINAVFEYHNHGLAIENDKLVAYTGGFVKKATVILKKNLIAIEDITTPKRAKKGIYSYKIHFFTNAATNVVKVKNITKDVSVKLQNLLTY